MGFDEPSPSAERLSPTRLSTSGHARYKGRSCTVYYLITQVRYIMLYLQLLNNDYLLIRILCFYSGTQPVAFLIH
jgi:hypothetical protein